MSGLEILHLRSSGEPLESLGDRIRESLRTEGKEIEVTLYRRSGLETDLAVHLRHPGAGIGEGPSDLALQLASELRAFGLLDHTLWEEF